MVTQSSFRNKSRAFRKKRSFVLYVFLVVTTMGLGLLSRVKSYGLPSFVGEYVGDALWALMVYWIFCLLLPKGSLLKVGFLSLLFSFGIESLQLYQEPWIQAIRHTTLGALVLGFGFKWEDLVCYSIGVGFGFILEYVVLAKRVGENHSS